MAKRVTVVSVYNNDAGHYPLRWWLQSCKSIAWQTHEEFDWVVVHFGRTLDPGAIFEDAHRRIRHFHEPAETLMAARNLAIGKVKTPLVMIQDGDDVYSERLIEAKLGVLDASPGTVAVACPYQHIDERGELSGEAGGGMTFDVWCDRLRKYKEGRTRVPPMVHGGALFSRAAFLEAGGYDGRRLRGGDTDLWCRLIKFGDFACVDEILFWYRRHAGQTIKRHGIGATL